MTTNEKTPLLGDGSSLNTSTNYSSNRLDDSENNSLKSSQSPVSEKSKGWTKKQLMVAAALSLQNVSLCISFGVISPFYPTEAEKKGASQTEVGLVFGCFQLVMFIACPIYGNFIHIIGAKFMFIAGSFILGGCSIAFGFLDNSPNGTIYVVMCFVCRTVEANGCAMLSTASFAIMAKTFPEDVGKALGTLEIFSGIGMVLGPSVGGGLYALGGYKLPFIVMGGVTWCTTIVAYFVLPSIEQMSAMTGNMFQILKIPGCVVIYFVICSCAIALSFLDPTFSPFMQKSFPDLSVAQIGLIFMTAPGVYAFMSPIAGGFADKGWQASLIVVGLFFCGFAFLLLGPSPIFPFIKLSLAETIIGLVVMGVSIGFGLIPVFPLVIRLVRNKGMKDDIQTLGIVSGYFSSGFSLGGFLGPTAAGYFDGKFGFPWASSICGFIILAVCGVFLIYVILMKTLSTWPVPMPDEQNDENSPDSYIDNRTSDDITNPQEVAQA